MATKALSRARVINWIVFAILLLGTLVVIYPFFIMIMNSFKTAQQINHEPLSLPTSISFAGYLDVFDKLAIGRLFANTLFVAVCSSVLNVVLNAMSGYALGKIEFPFREQLFKLMLVSIMIPGILLLIPSYSIFFGWGWVNTYKPLIIPGAVGAYNVFLVRQYMAHIPDEYMEAARIDGASEPWIFTRIIMPLSKPVLATVAILTFMGSWNDLFGPLLYLRDAKLFTLQLGLRYFQTSIPGLFVEQLYAGLVLATVPVVVVYLFLQRSFMEAFAGVGLG